MNNEMNIDIANRTVNGKDRAFIVQELCMALDFYARAEKRQDHARIAELTKEIADYRAEIKALDEAVMNEIKARHARLESLFNAHK
jgi:hypothetical protein